MAALRGTIATGFRAPTLQEEFYSGTNVSPSSATVQLPANSAPAVIAGFQPLKPEKSTNYSVGFVFHPMDGLQITLDAYQIDVKNRIQTTGFIYGSTQLLRSADRRWALRTYLFSLAYLALLFLSMAIAANV